MIFDRVEALAPARIVLDSLSELRLLAQSPLRYRRQILALKHFFSGRKSTVVLLDDLSSQQNDLQLHSIAHGVVLLEQLAIDYGAQRRRLRVVKMRGIDFKGGFHDFTIRHGGLKVYPRLVAAEHHKEFDTDVVLSGNAELDALLGGGLERGTNALLIGAAGVGKSSLALTYAIAAASRSERSVIFAFDEGRGTMIARAKTLGLPLEQALKKGLINIQQIDPAEMAPGEFADAVRSSVENDNAQVVIIDSLNGYLNAMSDERFLILQMHELLSYLSQRGVLTILVLAQHGLVGPMDTPLDISYLADGVSMVFGLAQQSGGALRLESAPSSGTTARLWLPVAAETTQPSGRTPNSVTQASGPARILFVDDDLLIAGSTVDLLEDLGHQVIEAHSAIEALRLLESGLAADLLITDHAMPGMTGIELAREVRRQYPRLPILLATGFAELEGGEVVDVARLAKPYTQAQLATEIAHLLPDGRDGF
jgi:KaiC/GvpD/RAD55 family RecA-like ATPase